MLNPHPDKIAIWLGTSHTPLDQWARYTEGLDGGEGAAPIEREIGWIDLDFFGCFAAAEGVLLPIEDLVAEAGTRSWATHEAIVARCKAMGIAAGNRLYYLCRHEFIPEADETDKQYNDLIFIGNFSDVP